MTINKIENIGFSSFYISFGIDDEYQKIIARLRMYGYEPTGNKSADRAKLHEIELREAKKENCVTTKSLTVSTNEQEKIQEKKREKKREVRKENNPELYTDTKEAEKFLGEQIYLAIKMKKQK